MAISFDAQNDRQLDAFLALVLDAYKAEKVTQDQAIGALAHVLTAAAQDDASEVLAWLSPEQRERWLREIEAAA